MDSVHGQNQDLGQGLGQGQELGQELGQGLGQELGQELGLDQGLELGQGQDQGIGLGQNHYKAEHDKMLELLNEKTKKEEELTVAMKRLQEDYNRNVKRQKRAEKALNDIKGMLECPITGEMSTDLVLSMDGNLYDRKSLMEWTRHNSTSPITRGPILEKIRFTHENPGIHVQNIKKIINTIVEYDIDDDISNGTEDDMKNTFVDDINKIIMYINMGQYDILKRYRNIELNTRIAIGERFSDFLEVKINSIPNYILKHIFENSRDMYVPYEQNKHTSTPFYTFLEYYMRKYIEEEVRDIILFELDFQDKIKYYEMCEYIIGNLLPGGYMKDNMEDDMEDDIDDINVFIMMIMSKYSPEQKNITQKETINILCNIVKTINSEELLDIIIGYLNLDNFVIGEDGVNNPDNDGYHDLSRELLGSYKDAGKRKVCKKMIKILASKQGFVFPSHLIENLVKNITTGFLRHEIRDDKIKEEFIEGILNINIKNVK